MHRLANDTDSKAIVEGLQKLYNFGKDYGFVKTVDFDKMCLVLWDTVDKGNAYIVDGYLVLVDTIVPWYTQDKLLQEWLVIRIYPASVGVSSIPPALLSIARERGCEFVISADSSPVNIVAKAYEGAGFNKLTTSYFKET